MIRNLMQYAICIFSVWWSCVVEAVVSPPIGSWKLKALISSQQRRAHLLDGGGVVQALSELAFGGGRRPQGGRKERALPWS